MSESKYLIVRCENSLFQFFEVLIKSFEICYRRQGWPVLSTNLCCSMSEELESSTACCFQLDDATRLPELFEGITCSELESEETESSETTTRFLVPNLAFFFSVQLS